MSAVETFAQDEEMARTRARAAAGNSDQGARVDAFLALCAELADAANRYVCPLTAARALVRVAVRAYAAERRRA
ncbi:hypothetical protein AB0E08_03670 [Streptomyces sp. NPDC048281]|uniref:hypothetical protein n=1 Tax=Streptomyces sp. NPDC048281 TaxID=3154715 RepID=UPI003421548D